jgi:hypothetical protein
MGNIKQEIIADIQKANLLWDNINKHKADIDSKQIESAELIKGILKHIGDSLLETHGVFPTMDLILSEDTNYIIGIKATWQSLRGSQTEIFLVPEEDR